MRTSLTSLILLLVFLVATSTASEDPTDSPKLQQSMKKQLFVFPVEFSRKAHDVDRDQRRQFEGELMRELVYNFPRFAFYEMPLDANVDEFLENANDYLLAHAQEIKQKRVDTGGRYGEAPITLEDLQEIVENGYAFVPRMTLGELKEDEWKLNAEIDIYRTHDQVFVGTIDGSSEGLGALMALSITDVLNSIDNDDEQRPSKKELSDQYRRKASGVVAELRTDLRKMDEFSIKAIVTSPGVNKFIFNQGHDLGVELDKRYKVWSTTDPDAEGRTLLAYGKVRDVRDQESDVQVLIGGWDLTYADQVVEDARFGINISPMIGFLPISSDGFEEFMDGTADIPGEMDSGDADLPEDGSRNGAWIGASLEINTASWSNLSEFYVTGEGGLVGGLSQTFAAHMSFGLTKKLWFRRIGWSLSGRYGLLHISFSNLEEEKVQGDQINNATVHGLMFATGLEILINPDWAIRGEVGYSLMPEQTVLREDSDDGHEAVVGVNGLMFKAGVLFSL